MQKRYYIFITALLVIVTTLTYLKARRQAVLILQSDSFMDGAEIPKSFTCQGSNTSPQLRWELHNGDTAASYLLVVDDPDAQRVVGKTFVHWIVLLPGDVTELPEGASGKGVASFKYGSELRNDFNTIHYGGPCPPEGSGIHTYRFSLFALNKSMEALRGSQHLPRVPFTAEQCTKALKQHIIAQATITGTYGR